MRKAKTIRKQLRQIIIQGNQREIQNLFHEIYQAHGEEFREDNRPTLDSFMKETLEEASKNYWTSLSGYPVLPQRENQNVQLVPESTRVSRYQIARKE